MTKSRKVRGYVKAVLRHKALIAELQARRARLKPLENRAVEAEWGVLKRLQALTGTQKAEAERLLKQPADVLATLIRPCAQQKVSS